MKKSLIAEKTEDQQRVNMSKLKTSTNKLQSICFICLVPTAVNKYLGSSLGEALQKIKQERATKKKMPKFSATPYDQAAKAEFKQKEILSKMMREFKVILVLRKRDRKEDEDPSTGSNQGKRKRSSGKDSEPSNTSLESKETYKGDTLPKSSKTSKFASAKESVKEATHKVNKKVKINLFNENSNECLIQLKNDSEPQTEQCTKEENCKTPYELFRGTTPTLDFMRPFGCHVTILNTLDYLGKFDGKSDDRFFVGYSLNSKAFRVYNIRTRKVEENLHIRFLEDKPIIAGDGPKWLFDIDVLTKSINYVAVVAGTNSNDFNASNDESQPSSDSEKKDDESGSDYQEKPENSIQNINTVGPSINTASPILNDGSLNINNVSLTVNTTRSNGSQSGPDMFPFRNNATLEATHVDFFGDETEVDMSNINTTYLVPSTPNTRIHKDYSLENVIGNEEPKKVIQALKDPSWIEAMQEELLQFKLQQVWTLVDLPYGKRAIGTKWVYKNKKDERGIVIRNKARLIEVVRLFLAYASFKDFVVYQMDVKSSFLYGKIKEEVYAPRAWVKGDILLVQVYVDDIIFGSTRKEMYIEFEKMMHKKFQMSSMGELTFFLGLQVTQKDDGIFINHDKYVDEILKKFGFSTLKTTSTPMETSKPLIKDTEAEDVDVHLYRSMIGSLMYLTASRPDIMFVVCACARFQVTPKVSHLHAVKRIFRYLKGQPKLGLWYPKDSPFEAEFALTKNPTIYVSLIEKFWHTAIVRIVDNGEQEITATVDGNEFTITEASVRRHLQLADVDGISALPTTEIFDQLSLMGEHTPLFPSMLAIQAEEGEGSGHPSKPQPPSCTAQPTYEEPIPNVVLSSHKKTQTPRQALNKVTKLPQTSEPILNVQDEAVYEEWDDKVKRATTTAASLDAEQGGTPSKVESLEADLKQTKQVYGAAYTKLIMKVKRLEKTVKTSHSRRRVKIVVLDDKEDLKDSSKQGRMIEEIDQDAGVTLVTPTQGEDQPEDQLGVLSAAKVLADAAKTNVHTYTRRRRAVSTGSGGISTAGASMPVSTAGMVQEVNISIPSPVVVKDKGKGKMEESEDEQTKRTKLQQEQERLGHEAAVRLQEELDEEERQRMARVHEAAQSFTEEEWENIRARVEADEELSKRLQAEERNKYSEVDQAKMLVDLINQRKKYFAAQKAKAKRNKPMTQAQQRNYMINYIKHMGSHTLQQLKRYSFDELKELFETTMKNVNTFVPMETEDRGRASELAAGSSQATIIDSAEVGSSKRDAEAELDHEGSKRQKTNETLGSVQEQREEEEKEMSQ
ncbi:putative ribonuclease H-like domain-containing protein [Tanacetum coccineum]